MIWSLVKLMFLSLVAGAILKEGNEYLEDKTVNRRSSLFKYYKILNEREKNSTLKELPIIRRRADNDTRLMADLSEQLEKQPQILRKIDNDTSLYDNLKEQPENSRRIHNDVRRQANLTERLKKQPQDNRRLDFALQTNFTLDPKDRPQVSRKVDNDTRLYVNVTKQLKRQPQEIRRLDFALQTNLTLDPKDRMKARRKDDDEFRPGANLKDGSRRLDFAFQTNLNLDPKDRMKARRKDDNEFRSEANLKKQPQDNRRLDFALQTNLTLNPKDRMKARKKDDDEFIPRANLKDGSRRLDFAFQTNLNLDPKDRMKARRKDDDEFRSEANLKKQSQDNRRLDFALQTNLTLNPKDRMKARRKDDDEFRPGANLKDGSRRLDFALQTNLTLNPKDRMKARRKDDDEFRPGATLKGQLKKQPEISRRIDIKLQANMTEQMKETPETRRRIDLRLHANMTEQLKKQPQVNKRINDDIRLQASSKKQPQVSRKVDKDIRPQANLEELPTLNRMMDSDIRLQDNLKEQSEVSRSLDNIEFQDELNELFKQLLGLGNYTSIYDGYIHPMKVVPGIFRKGLSDNRPQDNSKEQQQVSRSFDNTSFRPDVNELFKHLLGLTNYTTTDNEIKQPANWMKPLQEFSEEFGKILNDNRPQDNSKEQQQGGRTLDNIQFRTDLNELFKHLLGLTNYTTTDNEIKPPANWMKPLQEFSEIFGKSLSDVRPRTNFEEQPQVSRTFDNIKLRTDLNELYKQLLGLTNYTTTDNEIKKPANWMKPLKTFSEELGKTLSDNSTQDNSKEQQQGGRSLDNIQFRTDLNELFKHLLGLTNYTTTDNEIKPPANWMKPLQEFSEIFGKSLSDVKPRANFEEQQQGGRTLDNIQFRTDLNELFKHLLGLTNYTTTDNEIKPPANWMKPLQEFSEIFGKSLSDVRPRANFEKQPPLNRKIDSGIRLQDNLKEQPQVSRSFDNTNFRPDVNELFKHLLGLTNYTTNNNYIKPPANWMKPLQEVSEIFGKSLSDIKPRANFEEQQQGDRRKMENFQLDGNLMELLKELPQFRNKTVKDVDETEPVDNYTEDPLSFMKHMKKLPQVFKRIDSDTRGEINSKKQPQGNRKIGNEFRPQVNLEEQDVRRMDKDTRHLTNMTEKQIEITDLMRQMEICRGNYPKMSNQTFYLIVYENLLKENGELPTIECNITTYMMSKIDFPLFDVFRSRLERKMISISNSSAKDSSGFPMFDIFGSRLKRKMVTNSSESRPTADESSFQWNAEPSNAKDNLELKFGPKWMENKQRVPHLSHIYLGHSMFPIITEISRVVDRAHTFPPPRNSSPKNKRREVNVGLEPPPTKILQSKQPENDPQVSF